MSRFFAEFILSEILRQAQNERNEGLAMTERGRLEHQLQSGLERMLQAYPIAKRRDEPSGLSIVAPGGQV
jgi:hypothetical protein